MTEQPTEPTNGTKREPMPTGPKGVELKTLDDIYRFAKYVHASGLAPKGLDSPEAVTVALQYGLELGLTPMASLQNIGVVRGRPVVWGDALIGICMKSGWFDQDSYREWYEGEPGTDAWTAHTVVRRLGAGNAVECAFSVKDAKRAKLWGKEGPWTTHPARMLKYKARTFALRDAFPDVLKGLHTGEEMSEADKVLEQIELPDGKPRTQALTERLTAEAGRPDQPAAKPAEADNVAADDGASTDAAPSEAAQELIPTGDGQLAAFER